MARTDITEEQFAIVAAVAEREGWDDLETPPVWGASARTLAEQQAVAAYHQALGRTRRRAKGMDPRIARVIVVLACVIGLVACWMVSPGRTAVGLLVAGAFCLWSLRRTRARQQYPGQAARSPRSRMGMRVLRQR